jgi:AcrR family transcriptional regulator
MGLQERKLREFSRREHEILAASVQLLNADDWQTVTVDRIAEVAEVGKGTLYKHFSSKEDIYAHLTLNFYEGLIDELNRIDRNQAADLVLKESFEVALRYHFDNPEYRRVTQYCKRGDFKQRTSEAIQLQFREHDVRFRAIAGEMLNRCVESGAIPPAPFQQMFYGITTCFEGAVNFLWNGECLGDQLDVDEYISSISNFILAGLRGLNSN